MEPINIVNSIYAPLDRKNVDTDQIISKEFLDKCHPTYKKAVDELEKCLADIEETYVFCETHTVEEKKKNWEIRSFCIGCRLYEH